MANFYQILRWLMSITQNLWTIWCGMTSLQHSNTVTSSHCVRFHAKHYTLRHTRKQKYKHKNTNNICNGCPSLTKRDTVNLHVDL